jgi:hypothetical protein
MADSGENAAEVLGDVQTVTDDERPSDDPLSTDETSTSSVFDNGMAMSGADTETSDGSDLTDLGTDTVPDSTPAEDELLGLGDSSEGAETPRESSPAGDERAPDSPAQTEQSAGTFGELADRMTASRNKTGDVSDDGPSADTPPSAGSDRQLPLGANEPEFSSDLAPLVKPNMSAMLLGSLKSAPVDQACGELLTFPNGDDYNLLLVTVTQSAEDRLLTTYENSGQLPENIGVVAIDNNVSAQNTTQTIPIGGVDRTVQMKTATDPGDIKGIGIRISKQLSEWDDNDRPTMVCFHSLTSILQYISTKQLFQFIHLLQNRLRSYDAVVHYHIDPNVHEKMTLSQIKPLLDHVIEIENDGTCWIE